MPGCALLNYTVQSYHLVGGLVTEGTAYVLRTSCSWGYLALRVKISPVRLDYTVLVYHKEGSAVTVKMDAGYLVPGILQSC